MNLADRLRARRGPLRRAPVGAPGALAVPLALLFAGIAYAVVANVTYVTELNMDGGHDVPVDQRNLPGGVINVDCDNGPSNVTLFNQLGTIGGGTVGTFGAACGVDTPTPDPATTTRLLFEGRTQVITQVVDGDGIPVLGPQTFAGGGDAGDPIFFDADTGPPDHPVLDTVDTSAFESNNPAIQRDLANRRVIFDSQAALAGPLDLLIRGQVLNIPNGAGAPLGEVGATLSITIARQGGGQVPGMGTPISTFTGPFLIQPVVDPLPDPFNPTFDGMPDVEGAFAVAIDWTTSPDGIYDLTFFSRDVEGNQNPADGLNLTVQVVIDRSGPTLEIRDPLSPLIINEPGLCDFGPQFTLSGQLSDNLTQPGNVVLQSFHNDAGTANPFFGFMTMTTTLPFQGFWSVDYDFTTAPGGTPALGDQDLFVTTARATDGAGNLSNQDEHFLIWDRAPTLAPDVAVPPVGFTTSSPILDVSGGVTNVLTGTEILEEHGTLSFFLTLVPAVNPTMRTTFVVGGDPALTVHTSDLDTVVAGVFPFATGDNILGDIPDNFTFSSMIDMTPFPDGDYNLEVSTFDQACNFSPVTTVPFCINRLGPVITLDFGASGPDDNYDIPEARSDRPPNQFGADSSGATSLSAPFIVSLRSPERPDPGMPPLPIPVPFPPLPLDMDPGNQNLLFLSGTVTDGCTGVAEVRASGPTIPTTVFTVTPPMNSSPFTLGAIDMSNLPEGIPQRIDLQATNVAGRSGPTTSIVVLRDVIPATAPRITSPVQPFFTNQDTFDMTGQAEAGALLALLLPPTTGTPVAPIPRTTNGAGIQPPLIPNPRSLHNSIPVFAVTTRADDMGRFAFRDVSLQNVASALGAPTTLLVQAIDLFDNTDPVLSVTPFDVFRTTGVGNAIELLVDPNTLREIEAFPGPPLDPPTSGQFRGIELVDLQVTYDTLVVEVPTMTLTQNNGAAVDASLRIPADPTAIQTNVLTFRYPVRNVIDSQDGPVLVQITGGVDVFGSVLNSLAVTQAFFVDTVAPVLRTTAVPVMPADAQRISNTLPLLQAALEDLPATVTTTASGLSTGLSEVLLFGPLAINPDPVVATMPTTPTTGFDLAAVPLAPLTQDGAYRLEFRVRDNVGNLRVIRRTFFLDRVPVAAPSIDHDPDCDSFVNVLPNIGGVQAITAVISDPTIDLAASTLSVMNSVGATVPTTLGMILPNTLAAFPTPPLTSDGSADDRYTVLVDLVDLSGNATPQVTCPFTFDTTPPSLAIPSIGDGGCRNDPLRTLQVALADPPSPNSTSIFSAGVDLDRTQIEVRLVEPSFPNTTFPGTLVDSKVSYRTTPGTTAEGATIEFLDAGGRVRSLAADGSEDGLYRIETFVVDRAGNAATLTSTFGYDTQEPRIAALEFPDPSSFGGDTFTVMGEALDLGPCGLSAMSTPGASLATDIVEVRVVQRDVFGRPVSPITSPFYDFVPAVSVTDISTGVFTGISQRASFVATGVIPTAPGFPALLQVRVRDRAGNALVLDRRIEIADGPLPAPVLLEPTTAAFLDEKVLQFRWEPVRFADLYELELTRVTPTALTTSTTFSVDFPLDRRLVDLDAVVGSVPGGSPLTDPSAFTWRVRGLDVSGNAGSFSTTRSFTFDPVAPTVTDVLLGGTSITMGSVFQFGVTTMSLVFDEDSGLDPAFPPEVFLRLRDGTLTTLTGALPVTSGLTADGAVNLLPNPVLADPNGPATLVIRGARDLAGNAQRIQEFAVQVDVGPYIDLRLAPNPVDPLELLFAFVAREFMGGPAETVPPSATNPAVAARQQGAREFVSVPVTPVASTTPDNSAFRGVVRVSPNLIGFVDFLIQSTDADGNTGTRAVTVAAAPRALLQDGIVFRSPTGFSGLRVAPGGAPKGATVFALEAGVAPDGAALPEDGELQLVRDLGAFVGGPPELDVPATVLASMEDPAEAAAAVRAAGVLGQALQVQGSTPANTVTPEAPPPVDRRWGIYRADGDGWTYLDTARVGSRLEARTSRLGRFAVLADSKGPRAAEADEPGVVQLTDGGSGVDPRGVLFHGLAAEPVPGVLDPATGTAVPDPGARVRGGRRWVNVEARDRAGNTTTTRLAMTVLGAPSILEAIPVPNPVRFAPARLRYRLDRAGTQARLELFDTAGRRIAVLPGTANAGANEVLWDLRTRRGKAVANGVYLFRLRVDGAGQTSRATGKIAVLR